MRAIEQKVLVFEVKVFQRIKCIFLFSSDLDWLHCAESRKKFSLDFFPSESKLKKTRCMKWGTATCWFVDTSARRHEKDSYRRGDKREQRCRSLMTLTGEIEFNATGGKTSREYARTDFKMKSLMRNLLTETSLNFFLSFRAHFPFSLNLYFTCLISHESCQLKSSQCCFNYSYWDRYIMCATSFQPTLPFPLIESNSNN